MAPADLLPFEANSCVKSAPLLWSSTIPETEGDPGTSARLGWRLKARENPPEAPAFCTDAHPTYRQGMCGSWPKKSELSLAENLSSFECKRVKANYTLHPYPSCWLLQSGLVYSGLLSSSGEGQCQFAWICQGTLTCHMSLKTDNVSTGGLLD